MANPFQIGIRHALPAWPFLYLLAGFFFVFFAKIYPRIWMAALVLQLAEIAWHLPNLNAYTPVWMQPKQTLYRRMNDSSITYCNDGLIYLRFLQQNPEYKAPAALPATGKFALRLNDCNSYMPADGPLSCWLLHYFIPKGHYKSSILLFEISEDDLKSLPLPIAGP
jgi:hypothetical protein